MGHFQKQGYREKMPSIKIITTLKPEILKKVIKAAWAKADGDPLTLEASVYAGLLGISERDITIEGRESADELLATLLKVFNKKEKTWVCLAFFKAVSYSKGVFSIQLSPYVLPYLPILFDSACLLGSIE